MSEKKMMIEVQTLDKTPFETLHAAFVEAFSDYTIRIDMPEEKLRRMLARRSFAAPLSLGAFDDGFLVGFVLNGVRDLREGRTAYDTGTAVLPSHRRRGITRCMFAQTRELFKEHGVERYLLEVICENEPAVALYRDLGFETLRRFACFDLCADACRAKSVHPVELVDPAEAAGGRAFEAFWDFAPSWQNAPESLYAVREGFACVLVREGGEIAGYGIVERKTGDVPQLAVRADCRGKGVGGSIAAELLRLSEKQTLRFLNVDVRCDSALAFLRAVGCKESVGQYEMALRL